MLSNGGRLESITVSDPGSGYSASPTIGISAPPQIAFVGDATVVNVTDDSITLNSHPFETGDAVLFDSSTIDASAVAPTGLNRSNHILHYSY